MYEDDVLDDSEVCKGLPDASLVLFPESKEENNFCASEDFWNCKKKVCSDETHALTCGLVLFVFPCHMHYATNHIKQVFNTVSHLHFEVEKFCNVVNVHEIRACEAPINMNEKYGLFQFLRIQLQDFFKDMLSGNNRKHKIIF